MGYLIQYEGKTPAINTGRKKHTGWVAAWVFFLGLAAAKLFWSEFDHFLQQVIFPGSGEETVYLLEQAILDLRDGGSVGAVLHTFCTEVISHGAY